jgi:hypothetical protein
VSRDPRTFRALAAWFRHEWANSLPTKLHDDVMDAEGGPRWTSAMTRELSTPWPRQDDRREAAGVPRRRGLTKPYTGYRRVGDELEPLGVDEDGMTVNRFRYYLEHRLVKGTKQECRQAERLTRWAFLDFDTWSLAASERVDPEFMEAYLERALRSLYRDCQREPVRFRLCARCYRNACICAEKSESQEHAEQVPLDGGTGPPATIPHNRERGAAGHTARLLDTGPAHTIAVAA